VPPVSCPYGCGKLLDAVSDPTGIAVPKPGDGGICVRCGGLLIFADDLTQRRPTPAEAEELLGSENLRRLLDAVVLLPEAGP
jgi:hypothetical protein